MTALGFICGKSTAGEDVPYLDPQIAVAEHLGKPKHRQDVTGFRRLNHIVDRRGTVPNLEQVERTLPHAIGVTEPRTVGDPLLPLLLRGDFFYGAKVKGKNGHQRRAATESAGTDAHDDRERDLVGHAGACKGRNPQESAVP